MNSIFSSAQRAEVTERLGRLTPDAQRQWGRMSCHGAICHLSDAIKASLGDLPSRRAGTILHRTVIRFAALSVPMTWPHGAKTLPEFDQEQGGTQPGDFAADLRALEELVVRFVSSKGEGLAPHPAFGHLTPGEWGRWGYRHLDHHLRQFGV